MLYNNENIEVGIGNEQDCQFLKEKKIIDNAFVRIVYVIVAIRIYRHNVRT